MTTDSLPRGWNLRCLSEGATVIMGTSPKGNTYNHDGKGTPLLNGPTEFGPHHPTPVQWTTSPNRLCKTGDILFCVRGSTTGRMNWADQAYCLGRGLAAIRAISDKCLPEFLWYFLATQADAILHRGEGGVFPNFNKPQLEGMEIPLPDVEEQRRIVARIGELTSHIRQAVYLQREADHHASGLFQTGLESAFSEREIADWPIYETKQLFSPVNGQVDPRKEPYADVPHVGPDSIESGTCRLLPETIQTPRQLGLMSGKYPFGPEHVLYSKIRPALRKVALPDFSGVCSADMYPLLPNQEIITREFLAVSLLSPAFSQYAVDNSDRNAMPKINRKTLFAFEMPVPDKAIQKQITDELFGMQKKSETLAEMQRAIGDELDSFTPALLAKAFRGEL